MYHELLKEFTEIAKSSTLEFRCKTLLIAYKYVKYYIMKNIHLSKHRLVGLFCS